MQFANVPDRTLLGKDNNTNMKCRTHIVHHFVINWNEELYVNFVIIVYYCVLIAATKLMPS